MNTILVVFKSLLLLIRWMKWTMISAGVGRGKEKGKISLCVLCREIQKMVIFNGFVNATVSKNSLFDEPFVFRTIALDNCEVPLLKNDASKAKRVIFAYFQRY